MLSLDQIIVVVHVQLDGGGNARAVSLASDAHAGPRARSIYEAARRSLLSPACSPLRVPHRLMTEGATVVLTFNQRGLVQ